MNLRHLAAALREIAAALEAPPEEAAAPSRKPAPEPYVRPAGEVSDLDMARAKRALERRNYEVTPVRPRPRKAP